ncbi:MAG: SDR family NAD(P)-dependent oxidoreductase [Acidobacteriota bacterium]
MIDSPQNAARNDAPTADGGSRTILVTGATRGLGLALAQAFADLGHRVVGCGRDADRLTELTASAGAPHRFDRVDVTDDEAVRRWAVSVLETHGAPDLLINNAGVINDRAPLWKVPAEQMERVVTVNVLGVVHVLRHFVPAMIARGRGVIANMSSGWGRFSSPEVGPYCASKFAVEGLTGSLAKELPEGLAAVPVQPGIIRTDMLDSVFGEQADEHWGTDRWKEVAVPFFLALGPAHNGRSVRIPDHLTDLEAALEGAGA